MSDEKFVVVAGSGISKASPSNLPSWWEYNLILLEELNASASSLLPEGEHALTSNLMDYIPVVSVSDFLTRGAMGKEYFPLLKLLDSSSPNNIHYGLAFLAQRGQLKAIITTNFDTLLEQAFHNIGVPYRLLINENDYLNSKDKPECLIIKIHGSVTDEGSLIDTVTQKMKGLPQFKKQKLDQLFQAYHVYVLGYSGEDFRFGNNYLPIDTTLNNLGVHWIMHPGSSPSQYIDEYKDNSSFVLQEFTLEDWLATFKIKPYLDSVTTDIDEPIFADKARSVVKNALSVKGMGPYVNLGLSINLLDNHGDNSQALSLSEKAIAIISDKSYELDKALELIVLLSNAGLVFLKTNHYEKAANVFLLEKRIITESYNLLPGAAQEKEILIEFLMNLGTAIINLAKVYIERNDEGDSGKALSEFNDYIQLCSKAPNEIITDDRILNSLAIISFNQQRLIYNNSSDYDIYISQLKVIISVFKKIGNADSCIEALIEIVKTYLKIGEYDSSEIFINEIVRYLGVTKRRAHYHMYLLLQMELKVRRHQDCHSDFTELINSLSGEDDQYAKPIYIDAYNIFYGTECYQDLAIECLKQLQYNVKSFDMAEEYRRHIESLDSEFPFLIIQRIQQTTGSDSEYERYRTLIIIKEYLNDYEKLNNLWNRIHIYVDNSDKDRMKDFDYAFYKAVLRHDQGILRLEARNRYILDLIDEKKYHDALTLCDEIIESEYIDSPEYNIIKGCAYGNKSIIELMQNDSEKAIDDYNQAYMLLSASDASKYDLKTLIINWARLQKARGNDKEVSSALDGWIRLYGEDEDILNLK